MHLGGFSDFAGLDTAGANLHSLGATLRLLHPNGLQIRIESARGSVIRMRNIIAELRAFAANFASFSHDCFDTSELT